jgi:hypothetical protein
LSTEQALVEQVYSLIWAQLVGYQNAYYRLSYGDVEFRDGRAAWETLICRFWRQTLITSSKRNCAVEHDCGLDWTIRGWRQTTVILIRSSNYLPNGPLVATDGDGPRMQPNA